MNYAIHYDLDYVSILDLARTSCPIPSRNVICFIVEKPPNLVFGLLITDHACNILGQRGGCPERPPFR